MKITKLCQNYFNGFQQTHNGHAKSRYRILKVSSYFTLITPLIVATTYGIATLHNRIHKKKSPSNKDKILNKTVTNSFKNPTPIQTPVRKNTNHHVEVSTEIIASKEKPVDGKNDSPKATISEDLSPKIDAKSEHKPIAKLKLPSWLYAIHLSTYIYFLGKKADHFFYKNTVPTDISQLKTKIIYHEFFDETIDPRERKICCNYSHKPLLAYPLLVKGNHWTLVVLDLEKRTLEYYDSKQNYGGQKTLDDLKDLTDKLTKLDKLRNPNNPPFTFVAKIQKELQPDSYQCGIWVLYFMEERLKNSEIDFNQLDITDAQDMIAKHRSEVSDMWVSLNPNDDTLITDDTP